MSINEKKYSARAVLERLNMSNRRLLLRVVDLYQIPHEKRKSKKGTALFFTMEQVQQIEKALEAENKKIKENSIKHKAEMLLKAHPEGLTIKEIAKHFHKSISHTRSFIMGSVDLPIWDDGRKIPKYYYAGETKVKENRTIILAKQCRLITAIKKSKTGLTLKEAARILKVSPPEAREFISSIDERENIECISTDDGIRYRYAGF